MKIAICDDDNNDLMKMQQFIEMFNPDLRYELFHSADELLEAFKSNFYDLVFMEIIMQPINGLIAAKTIKKKYEKSLIVFTSISKKYSIIGYEFAFRYLVKPVIYENLIQVLRVTILKLTPRKIRIDSYILPTNSIYFIEVFRHNIVIHTQDGSYDLRNSLKNIESKLCGGFFTRPHNSFLVNMDYIVGVTQAAITLKNGTVISISRSKKEKFFEELNNYLKCY